MTPKYERGSIHGTVNLQLMHTYGSYSAESSYLRVAPTTHKKEEIMTSAAQTARKTRRKWRNQQWVRRNASNYRQKPDPVFNFLCFFSFRFCLMKETIFAQKEVLINLVRIIYRSTINSHVSTVLSYGWYQLGKWDYHCARNISTGNHSSFLLLGVLKRGSFCFLWFNKGHGIHDIKKEVVGRIL